MNTGRRIIETLHGFDLRDKEATREALGPLIDEINHSLVCLAYLIRKDLREAAEQAILSFERGTGMDWDEFQTFLATALEERRTEGPV